MFRLCGVAFFFVGIAAFGLATRSEESRELRIMTYNIRTASRWALEDGKDGVYRRSWRERKRSVAQTIKISGAAVVATQEGLDWQLTELTGLLGASWKWIGGGRVGDGSDEDEHAAILFDSERLQLSSSEDFWLSETPEKSSKAWGAALPRVATVARFRSEHVDFTVVNVHLDHSSELARTMSAKLLRERLFSRHQEELIFLAGDFNAPKDEQWYVDLTADDELLADAWVHAETKTCGACGQSTYHAWKGSRTPTPQWMKPYEGEQSRNIALSGTRHIDCIFYNAARTDNEDSKKSSSSPSKNGRLTKARVITDDKRRSVYGGPFASDHYPVCVHWLPDISPLRTNEL